MLPPLPFSLLPSCPAAASPRRAVSLPRLAVLAAFAVVAPLAGVADARAQDQQPTTPTTPPRETREEGPPFPKPEIKAQKPSDQVPEPMPGNFDPRTLPSPLTLAQAIDLALRLQPDIVVAQANREASEQRLRQAETGYYPRVTPSYTYQTQYTFGTVNRFLGGGVVVPVATGQTQTNRQGEVSFNYTLFNSFQREYQNRQARQGVRSSLFGEQNTRQGVISQVADNYFNSLRQEALVRVSEAQVLRAQNTRDVVAAQVEAGVSRRIDIYQAEADLLNAQVALVRARNNAEVAQAQLKNALGLAGGGRIQLADVPPPTPETPLTATLAADTPGDKKEGEANPPAPAPAPAPTTPAAPPAATPAPVAPTAQATPGAPGQPGAPDAAAAAAQPSIAQLAERDAGLINQYVDLAYRIRPDVAQSSQSVEINETGVKLSRVAAGLQVTTSISGGYQYSPSTGNNRAINVGLSYPLFDAGLTRSQVRESQAQVRTAEAQLTSLRQQVAVEVEQAYRNLSQARASLPAADAAQRAAQINYEASLEARREGVGSIVDVITAQTSLVQAQTNYVQAIYDFYAADAALARAVGQADRIARAGAATPDKQQTAPSVVPPAPITPTTPATPPPGGTPAPPASNP